MPYWIAETLATTPAFAWVYLGLGLPWALALLPRADWRRWPVALALAFVCGPALLTAWMFILGTLGAQTETPLLRLDLILIGTAVLAALGGLIAWRQARRTPTPPAVERAPLALDERLLIGLMAIALIVRWFVTAYWPFIAYDTLWVYGYQGRLYTLLGLIPNSIDYYPQFLSLQYAFGQIAHGGIADHAARAVVPFINLGSTLAVYTLGERLFGRRAGIYAAALWTLYHHVGEWSRMGDLEIALTSSFTLAAAFFVLAQRSYQPGQPLASDSRRWALIAGLALGVALWTKPTGGAFVWGTALMVLGYGFASPVFAADKLSADRKSDKTHEARPLPTDSPLRLRRGWGVSFPALWPRLQIGLITGLAAAPLGGVWYVRNLLLGHYAIDFPPAFWLTQAARSGAEFGWPLLAILLLTALLLGTRRIERAAVQRLLIGLALLLAGLLPSIVAPRRLEALEYVLIAAGALVWAAGIRRSRPWLPPLLDGRVLALLTLALPYFVTWFWSYSYHYRLSFPIVPLLLLAAALIAAAGIARLRTHPSLRALALTGLIALSIPGIVLPLYDQYAGWDVLLRDPFPTDLERQRSGNPALLNVVDGIQAYIDAHGQPPVVSAPGVQTLPFFFPLADIRIDDAPTRLDELAAATYFIDSHPQGTGAYERVPLLENQVISALGRVDILRRAWGMDDGIFRYAVYELALDRRWQPPQPNGAADREIVWGGFARYLGNDLGGLEFWTGRPVMLTLYWQVLAPAGGDYMTYIHLRSATGDLIAAWDGPTALQAGSAPARYYSTLLWQPGEYIADPRVLRIDEADLPVGGGYSLVVGMYDLATGTRVPVSVDGAPAGDGYVLDDRIAWTLPPEGS